MSNTYRVIDDGTVLTVGKVMYSPEGDPITVELDVLQSNHLTGLRDIVVQIQQGFDEPVISLRESGCEVV